MFTLFQTSTSETVSPTSHTDDLIIGPGDFNDSWHILCCVWGYNNFRVDVAAEAIVYNPSFGVAVGAFGKDFAADWTLKQIN